MQILAKKLEDRDGAVYWIIFPQGEIDDPFCIVTDHEMNELLYSIEREKDYSNEQ